MRLRLALQFGLCHTDAPKELRHFSYELWRRSFHGGIRGGGVCGEFGLLFGVAKQRELLQREFDRFVVGFGIAERACAADPVQRCVGVIRVRKRLWRRGNWSD